MASATKIAPTSPLNTVAINQDTLRRHACYGMQEHLDSLNRQFSALRNQLGYPGTGRITLDMLDTSNTRQAGQGGGGQQLPAGTAPVKRAISAATRKKQSQVQKARWAAIRAGQVLPAGKGKARAA